MGRKNSAFDIHFMGKECEETISGVKSDFYEGIELAVMRGVITADESKTLISFFKQATPDMMNVIISVCFAGFNLGAREKVLDIIGRLTGQTDG